jgi:hypothetical protein
MSAIDRKAKGFPGDASSAREIRWNSGLTPATLVKLMTQPTFIA